MLLPGRLATSVAVPGTESDRAEAALARGFGERTEGTFTVVFHVRHSSDKVLQDRLRERLVHASRTLPGGRLGTFRAGAGVVYGELETSLSLRRAKAYTSPLREALASSSGPAALVTGQPAIQHDLDPQLSSDLHRAETLALPLALIVLSFVLGASLALALPFVVAACTIAGTLALVLPATQLVSVTSYATNLVVLVALGLAVDYSLLIVTRYRDELEAGADREEALVRTMARAGRTVCFSGVAVAIGLALLLVVPVPFIRTMGLAGLLVPLVSLAAALTLQPALLSLCGPGVFRRARLPLRTRRPRKPWAALARAIMRRPVTVLALTTTLLLAAAAPVLFLGLSPGSLSSLPRSTEATRGLATLNAAFGPGASTPTEIVVDSDRPGGSRRPEVRAAVARLADRLFHEPEVYVVATGRQAPYVSSTGRYARVFVLGRHEYGEPASRRLVARIRDDLVPAARFPGGTHVLTGGAPAKGVDFLARTYAFLPWLVLIMLAATYLLLVRALRSLLLPLKAVVLNLLSVAASLGLIVVIFQWGVGSDLLGVQRASQLEGWVPLFLFATVFGLSMDYEVFLVSRMREEWEAGRDNAAAVCSGLEHTGRLITAAALVMAVSVGGFAVGGVPGLQQFGLGLALAILIDATLVRALLVPSLMAVAGRWNWWLPSRPGRARPLLPPSRLEEALDEA